MKTILSTLAGVVLAGAGLAASMSSMAGTVNGTMPVTSSVVAACAIQNAFDLDLTNLVAPAARGNGIIVSCTKGTAASIAFNQGVNAKASSTCDAPQRQMKNAAGNLMSYTITSQSDSSVTYGCGTSNKLTYNSTTAANTLIYYNGSIDAGQDVQAGTYTDTITLTMSF